jgi:transcription elongation factor GreA
MQRRDIRKPDTDPVHLTEGGLLRMQNRLAELKAALPDLMAEAARTAAEGDRSDNDAYKQSKGLLRRTYRQIWSIEEQLKRVVVIKTGKNDSGTIQLGSRVTLEIERGGKKSDQKFEIVGPHETNPKYGRISHVSPLGKALLGRRKDEIITLPTANGPRKYSIKEIA